MNEYQENERFDDPRNGQYGEWHVSGMVDEKAVRASSAREAIEVSGIPEWQNPTAAFARPLKRVQA